MPGDNEAPRFSDAELVQLRKDFDEHKKEQYRKWSDLAETVEQNTKATERLAESVEGVVRLYADIQSTVRVGTGVQRFLTWLLKLGAAGAAIAAGLLYVLNKFGATPGG